MLTFNAALLGGPEKSGKEKRPDRAGLITQNLETVCAPVLGSSLNSLWQWSWPFSGGSVLGRLSQSGVSTTPRGGGLKWSFRLHSFSIVLQGWIPGPGVTLPTQTSQSPWI